MAQDTVKIASFQGRRVFNQLQKQVIQWQFSFLSYLLDQFPVFLRHGVMNDLRFVRFVFQMRRFFPFSGRDMGNEELLRQSSDRGMAGFYGFPLLNIGFCVTMVVHKVRMLLMLISNNILTYAFWFVNELF